MRLPVRTQERRCSTQASLSATPSNGNAFDWHRFLGFTDEVWRGGSGLKDPLKRPCDLPRGLPDIAPPRFPKLRAVRVRLGGLLHWRRARAWSRKRDRSQTWGLAQFLDGSGLKELGFRVSSRSPERGINQGFRRIKWWWWHSCPSQSERSVRPSPGHPKEPATSASPTHGPRACQRVVAPPAHGALAEARQSLACVAHRAMEQDAASSTPPRDRARSCRRWRRDGVPCAGGARRAVVPRGRRRGRKREATAKVRRSTVLGRKWHRCCARCRTLGCACVRDPTHLCCAPATARGGSNACAAPRGRRACARGATRGPARRPLPRRPRRRAPRGSAHAPGRQSPGNARRRASARPGCVAALHRAASAVDTPILSMHTSCHLRSKMPKLARRHSFRVASSKRQARCQT